MCVPSSMTPLAVRVTVHSILPVAVFAVVLCVSAGTLRFWQTWAYLAFHLGVMMATNLHFLRVSPTVLEGRLKLVEENESDAGQRRIIRLVGLTTLAMLVTAGLDHRMGWSSVAPTVLVAAYLAMASGSLLIFLVMRENAFAASVVEIGAGQRVVDSGPYGVIRHPMYSGFLLIGATTPLVLGSYWAELAIVPLAALLTARLVAEERFLAKRLPGYTEYMARRAHRLIPGVF